MIVKDGRMPFLNASGIMLGTSSGVILSLWYRRPLPTALGNKLWGLRGALSMFTRLTGLPKVFGLASAPTVAEMAACAGVLSSKTYQAEAPYASRVKVLHGT